MKRPSHPSGQAPRLVTGATSVIEPVRVEAPSSVLLRWMLRTSIVLILVGCFVSVLAVMNASVLVLIFSVGVVAAGLSLASLEALIDVDSPELDERAWALLLRVVGRMKRIWRQEWLLR